MSGGISSLGAEVRGEYSLAVRSRRWRDSLGSVNSRMILGDCLLLVADRLSGEGDATNRICRA